jgi:hypothetical protein
MKNSFFVFYNGFYLGCMKIKHYLKEFLYRKNPFLINFKIIPAKGQVPLMEVVLVSARQVPIAHPGINFTSPSLYQLLLKARLFYYRKNNELLLKMV